MPIIQLKNITKFFGKQCVIPSLNLDIEKGEFITLLGPSGCGKTTLLRIIAGFEAPTNGTVLLDGEDITALPPYQRNVNTVFQNYALFPHLNVLENVAFGLKQKKVPASNIAVEVEKALETVQMTGFAHRKPKELSGGQQQRIALARAIVNKPKVLLLDEPLAALDLKLRKQMQVELKTLHHQLGITFVFVTHDQEEALTMSDRIAVINKGVVEQLDTPQNVYNYPATKFAADFIGDNNTLRGNCDGERFQLKDSSVPLSGKVRSQGNAYLFIRPEHIVIHQHQPEAAFGLPAIIQEKIFLGNQWKIQCVLQSGEKMEVVIKPDQLAAYEGAKKIYLNWDPNMATVAFE
jgi:spermidine/putrescine transport system ATP-binding protein